MAVLGPDGKPIESTSPPKAETPKTKKSIRAEYRRAKREAKIKRNLQRAKDKAQLLKEREYIRFLEEKGTEPSIYYLV
jgi:hypothetical protein